MLSGRRNSKPAWKWGAANKLLLAREKVQTYTHIVYIFIHTKERMEISNRVFLEEGDCLAKTEAYSYTAFSTNQRLCSYCTRPKMQPLFSSKPRLCCYAPNICQEKSATSSCERKLFHISSLGRSVTIWRGISAFKKRLFPRRNLSESSNRPASIFRKKNRRVGAQERK